MKPTISWTLFTKACAGSAAPKRRCCAWGICRDGRKVLHLLVRDFNATAKNEKWITDTTAIPTREGWLYLVNVMDRISHQIVGWAMGKYHDAALATPAPDMAIRRARIEQATEARCYIIFTRWTRCSSLSCVYCVRRMRCSSRRCNSSRLMYS